MRHKKKTVKLGRSQAHRDSLLSNQVCSLIEHRRIKTTLAKAKATKPLAERMVTLGKKGDLHARRTALSYLKHKEIVKKLFTEIAPAAADRKGGYTRIVKLGARLSDSAPMAYLEWVDYAPEHKKQAEEAPKAEKAPAKKKAAPKKKAAEEKKSEE
jgi:large subunit ribosomal protein L17